MEVNPVHLPEPDPGGVWVPAPAIPPSPELGEGTVVGTTLALTMADECALELLQLMRLAGDQSDAPACWRDPWKDRAGAHSGDSTTDSMKPHPTRSDASVCL